MERHYQKIVRDTGAAVEQSLRMQVLDEGNPRHGGFTDKSGVVQAKFAIYRVASMAAAYCNRDTAFYQEERVLQSILLGLRYVRRVQHENGLFDFAACNFLSVPDTAFCLKRLLPVYRFLRERGGEGGLPRGAQEIAEELEPILRAGAGGLLEGGFHTPNHRWAIASVLMACSRLFESREMEAAARLYLREGIDCNADGEFAERSAGNYNRINNDAMILLSEATGDASYEQNAIRNLRMMLSYWEPDGSIFTANSIRFDRDLLVYPVDYYLEYLKMGMKYQIPEFLQMCNTIFTIIEEKQLASPDILIWFMLEPAFRSLSIEGSYRGEDFRAFYRESAIARGRQGRFTYTVLGGKPDFFYLHNGSMKLQAKVAGGFFEHRAFESETMEPAGEGKYHLFQCMRGWYYLPFEEKPASSDWWKMDNAARPQKRGPDMQVDVWVSEVEGGIDLRVKACGAQGAPWRIELVFSGAELLAGDYLEMPLSGGEALVVKQGDVTVSGGPDALTVGPCFGEHRFSVGKGSSGAHAPGTLTLCLTDYTPFDRTVHICNRLSLPR